MLCPVCRVNSAVKHDYYGFLPCVNCQNRTKALRTPDEQVEFTTDSIKEQRRAHGDDTEQPHYKGELSKRWLDLRGENKALEYGFSPQEIKRAKYINTKDSFYKRHS